MNGVNGEALAGVVRDTRKRLGLTQEELAARAQIRRETVSSIEGGTVPTLETLARVSDALGVPVSFLLAKAEPGQRWPGR